MTDLAAASARYHLVLFVTGATPRSLRAIDNLRRFLDAEVPDDYDLEIVDLYREPGRAKAAQVFASPTLMRDRPLPARYAIGDMSRPEQLRAVVRSLP